MKLTKKQALIYIITFIALLGSATFVRGVQPDPSGPLWERIWKVEEPVSIEGTETGTPVTIEGTVIVDTNSNPLEVTLEEPVEVEGTVTINDGASVEVYNELKLAPGTEVRVPGHAKQYWKLTTRSPGTILRTWIDTSGYKTVFVYVEHSESVTYQATWAVQDGYDTMYIENIAQVHILHGSGQESIVFNYVQGNKLLVEVTNTSGEENDMAVWYYVSPV
jgi:hypothetical protein